MKTAALFFCAIVLCVHAISDDEIRRQWQEFQETYQKTYRSPVEAQKRFSIFKEHLEEIDEHNKLYEEGKVTWKEGINKFSDWTKEEIEEYDHGIIVKAVVADEKEIDRKWTEFQQTYKKSYRSPVEEKERFEIFKKNVLRIEEHNSLYEQGLVSDKESINQFSDWTQEEFENYINKGLLPEDPIVMANEDEEIQRKWTEFQETYKKSYRSPVEEKERFEIFKKNVLRIEEHNSLYEQSLVSDKESINQFSDWTQEEFENYINKGLLPEDPIVMANEDEEIQRKWSEFQETYKKSYRSPVEEQKRFEIFKKNVLRIEEHNSLYEQGLVSDKESINQFSDWTQEEFENYINKGLLPEDPIVMANEDEEIQRKWTEFQETYKKSYRSPVEEKKRFEIFKKNVLSIEEHNSLYEQGLVSTKESINQFSDWTQEEFENYINKGLLPEDPIVMANEDEEIQRKWSEFQETYKKSYRSPVEEKERFEIFKKNVLRIEEHNSLYEQGLVSDKESINQFSDWTQEEFENYINKGLLPEDPIVMANEDEEIQRKWTEFQQTYKKSYRSPVEEKKRFEIFKKNVLRIEEHNSLYEQGLVSDKEGINRFADWTQEEFKNYINKGLLPEDPIAKTTEDDMQQRWQEFQRKYGKTYRSSEEAQKRFEIFKENVKKIDEHNALFEQGKTSFIMGINEFSDWTHEEFVEWLKSH